jgi:hypothetical protein
MGEGASPYTVAEDEKMNLWQPAAWSSSSSATEDPTKKKGAPAARMTTLLMEEEGGGGEWTHTKIKRDSKSARARIKALRCAVPVCCTVGVVVEEWLLRGLADGLEPCEVHARVQGAAAARGQRGQQLLQRRPVPDVQLEKVQPGAQALMEA